MKKIIFLLAAALSFGLMPTSHVTAQTTTVERVIKKSTDTTVNADTTEITALAMGSNVKSFQFTVNRLSGTAAGWVILRGRNDGANWVTISTDTLTNVATQTFGHAVTSTSYYDYEAYYKTSGTQTSTIWFSWCRRPDEHY